MYPGLLGNCSGTLRSIEYCYLVMGDDRQLFNFFSLSHNGLNFSITQEIPVSEHQGNCAPAPPGSPPPHGPPPRRKVCCTVTNNLQVTITPSNFSFGIILTSPQLLFFSDTATKYHVKRCEKLQDIRNGELPRQLNFTAENCLTGRPFSLMRFSRIVYN